MNAGKAADVSPAGLQIPIGAGLAAEFRKIRGLVEPFSFSIAATVLTTAFGVLTNKIVAVSGGPALAALVGLYRQLYAAVAQGLSLGTDVTVVQTVSADASERNLTRIATVGLVYMLLAGGFVGLVALFLSESIARALFGRESAALHALEVGIVLMCSLTGLSLVLVMAILNGLVAVRRVLFLNVISSAMTAASAYVLITYLHSVGSALLVGFGNLLALPIGIWFVRGHIRLQFPEWSAIWSELLRLGKSGSVLTVLNLLAVGVMLAVQTMVARTYGLGKLGIFTASYTVISSFMMLFMSPMKVYVLPMLGRLQARTDRNTFVNQTIKFALVVVFPFAGVLLLSKALVIRLLYSSEFSGAGELLAVESLGIIPRTVSWVLAIYALSASRYATYAFADTLRAIIIVAGSGLAAWLGLSVVSIAWVFFAAYLVDLVFYVARSSSEAEFRLSPGVAVLATVMMGAIAALYGVTR